MSEIEHKGSWWPPEPVQERTRRDQCVPSRSAGGEVNTRADHHLRTLRYQQAGLRGTLARAPPLTSTTLLSKRAMSAPPITNEEVWQIGRPGSKTCWFKSGCHFEIKWGRSLNAM